MSAWRRVKAGVYEHEDGQVRLVRCEHEDAGPRGGKGILWERVTRDSTGWVIGGGQWETLAEAKAEAVGRE